MEDALGDSSSTPTTLTTSIYAVLPTLKPFSPMALDRAQALLAEAADSPTHDPATVHARDSTVNGVVIGLLSSFGSAVFIALFILLIYFLRYTSRGRILLDRIGRPGQYDDEQAFAREEAEALDEMDDLQRTEYFRAKGMCPTNLLLSKSLGTGANVGLSLAFIQANPPDSLPTDISLSQYLAIQEKGVSAWEFEPELEIANCFVEARTEIEFFDSECSVLSNLPLPKQNEVYYWESKIYDKPDTSMISIGVATKPYPLFRLPGMFGGPAV